MLGQRAAAFAIWPLVLLGASAQEQETPKSLAQHAQRPAEPREKREYDGFWDDSYFSFNRGYVFRWDRSGKGKDALYSPDGNQLYEVIVKPAETWVPFISTAAVDPDGLVAFAYASWHESGSWHGGIAILNQSGQTIRFIDTFEYSPSQLCFAPDHSLWVYGKDRFRPVRDYPIFRRYSPRDGRQLGAYVLRSELPPWNSPFVDITAGPVIGGHRLQASNDRIGALFVTAGSDQLWVELDFAGNLLGQWKIDGQHSPSAFTADGNLYAGVWEHDRLVGTAVFDKVENKWDRVEGVPVSTPIGTDGNDLVYRLGIDPPVSFLGWFTPTPETR